MIANPTLPFPSIRPPCIPPIRHLGAASNIQSGIQEMVHDVHPLLHRLREPVETDGAIDGAGGEARVEGVEGRFPEIGEFVEDVGDFDLVGARVEEDE